MSDSRKVQVLIAATVELAEDGAYPPGATLAECIAIDIEGDPTLFWMDQVLDQEITVVEEQ